MWQGVYIFSKIIFPSLTPPTSEIFLPPNSNLLVHIAKVFCCPIFHFSTLTPLTHQKWFPLPPGNFLKIHTPDIFPKPFSQAETSHGYFPKWQLPKCAISQAATTQVCPNRNARPSQPVLAELLGPIANPSCVTWHTLQPSGPRKA